MIIYKTTNLINGKGYTGQDSKNRPFYFGSGNLIELAIKKYGKGNFVKEIIEFCNTYGELNEREIFWIAELNTKYPNGYNLTDGGGGTSGYKHTEEQRINNSKAKIGHIPWNKGKIGVYSDKTIEKMNLNNHLRKLSESDIPIIRQLVKEKNLTQRQIGEQFGVSNVTISRIKNRRRWRHIK